MELVNSYLSKMAILIYSFHITRGNCEEVVFPLELRNLRLKFLSKLSLPVFTGTRIEGEDGAGIKVALIDSFTDEVVQYNPESSAKVEIVVLEGDFDGDEGNNIVREREGKKSLLTGDVSCIMLFTEG